MAKTSQHGCAWWLVIGWWWQPIVWFIKAVAKACEYLLKRAENKSSAEAEPVVLYKGKPIRYECPLESRKTLNRETIPAKNPSDFSFENVLVLTETVFEKETGEIRKVEKTVFADHAQTEHVKHLAMEMLAVYAKTATKENVERAASFISCIREWGPSCEEEPPRGAHPCYEYRGDKARFTVTFNVEDYDPFTNRDYAAFGRVNKNGDLMDGTLRFYEGTHGDVFSVKRFGDALVLVDE